MRRSISPISSSNRPIRAHCSRSVSITIAGRRSETRARGVGHRFPHPGAALRHHLAVLGQQAAQPVDLSGAELHQLLAHPVKRQNRLLLLTLDRDRPDAGLLRRRPDRPRVLHIVLVAGHKRPHCLRRQQPDLRDRDPRSRRAQCCVPPHASIATKHDARLAKCSRNFARVSFRFTISPVSISTQCSWNTRFAVSTPTTVLLVFISDPPVCL